MSATTDEEWFNPLENFNLEYGFGSVGKSIVLKASSTGMAVSAVQSGFIKGVTFTGNHENLLVVIEHNSNLVTAYAGLQNGASVKVGQKIEQSEIIGYLEKDLLKFWVHIGSGNNAGYIDPAIYLGLENAKPNKETQTKSQVINDGGCVLIREIKDLKVLSKPLDSH